MKPIDSSEEFWKTYQSLQWLLMEAKKDAVVEHLNDARESVNGLGDGWHEIHAKLRSIEKMWPTILTGEIGEHFARIKAWLIGR